MSEKLKYDAFISYSRRDFDEVQALLHKIRREVPEFNYWFDLQGIESGEEFVRKIVAAIDGSERVLFMLSDNSINSKWAEQEVMYARNSDKRIIPVLLKGAKLRGWFLFTFGNIDTIDTQDSRQMAKLIANLRQWCGTAPTKPTPPKAKKKPTEKPVSTPVEPHQPKDETTIPVPFKRKGKWGYKNNQGKTVIPCIYDFAYNFSEGYAHVQKDKKYGFIDVNGDTVLPFIYDWVSAFHEGRAQVSVNHKKGYIDALGNNVVPCIYEHAFDFSEGYALVIKDGKCGFIDINGNPVIPFIYDWGFYCICNPGFHDGRALVKKDGVEFHIDRNGNKID